MDFQHRYDLKMFQSFLESGTNADIERLQESRAVTEPSS